MNTAKWCGEGRTSHRWIVAYHCRVAGGASLCILMRLYDAHHSCTRLSKRRVLMGYLTT